MSEWRDFLEGVELTERQERIYELACLLAYDRENGKTGISGSIERIVAGDELKHLLIEEFTGVRII